MSHTGPPVSSVLHAGQQLHHANTLQLQGYQSEEDSNWLRKFPFVGTGATALQQH